MMGKFVYTWYPSLNEAPTFRFRDADRDLLPWSTGEFNRIRLKLWRTRKWKEQPRVRKPHGAVKRKDRLIIRRRYGAYMRRQRRH